MSLLQVSGITKHFGGLTALDDVTFEVHEGMIKALIGPNGAGKSTLFNLLTAYEQADSGEVLFDGQDLAEVPAHKIVRMGIARTFQNTQLFEEMTALENVMVGFHPQTKSGMLAAALRLPATIREQRWVEEESERLLRVVGLEDRAGAYAADLPHGMRRALEIARAMATGPRLLLLDEPAAGLNAVETARLAEVLYRIRDRGVTLVVVEHDMGLVMEISDEIVVLNEGRKIAEGPPLLIQKDPAVVEAYLGEPEDE